jgi:hypothetical protein
MDQVPSTLALLSFLTNPSVEEAYEFSRAHHAIPARERSRCAFELAAPSARREGLSVDSSIDLPGRGLVLFCDAFSWTLMVLAGSIGVARGISVARCARASQRMV